MPGAVNDDALHPIKEGQVRRLYQLIMVQHVLNEVLSSVQPPQSTEGLEPVSNKGPKEIYQCFVNKLAQILDLKHGGDFVTAIAILQPGCIEYRISSNGRSKGEFQKATKFLKDNILVPLGQATDEELEDAKAEKEMRSSMLLKILEFARRRIIKYIRDLRGSLDRDHCLSECESEETEDARTTAPKLRELLPLAVTVDETYAKLGLAQKSSRTIINWGPFTEEANALLQVIKTYWSSPSFERYLRAKCGPSRAPHDQTSPWGDLFHAIGRLHSYNIALQYFFEARRQWPILFEPTSLEVTYVTSAPKSPNPLQVKERLCTGKDIINRHFDREPEVVEAYQSLLPQLEQLKFDDLLKEEIKSTSYHTVVHAEVSIADSLYHDYRDPEVTSGVRFFNEAEFGRYIGCSKPTCVLCDYYLAEHPLRFRRRMGHGNMYYKWRPADIFKTVDQPGTGNLGEALAETRRRVLEGVIREIRKTVSATILQRTASRSKYDSRHTPSDPMGMGASRWGGSDYGSLYLAQAAGGGRGVLEDVREVTEGDSEEVAASSVDDTTETLTGPMGRLSVVDGVGSGKRKGKEVWARNRVFEDDDDDEGGGVQLRGHAQ